ncbi:SHOCT domain-containing protein [Microbacterium kyungheense]|uniref:Putative oligomerization/nucleic acid binding protein n=1 Tax=Microbacterium kyungheense TaxID=1263636 RepID=A0A543F144_9MICO|nr:SHOCT domain-containing protein [Microbacterium kyungheense]TQM27548.1 putative oligomerization/nucleic acid binding protein [Microbacterium kyungheense]
MVGYGRVIGGDYKGAAISTPVGSTLVVQAGLKMRRLLPDNVSEWEELPTDSKGNPVGAVGQAVVGAVLPGQLGKAASAAFGATVDAMGPSHTIRVDWADGKRSLLKLPDSMFRHFAMVLNAQRVFSEPVPVEAAPVVEDKPTITDKAFDLVSGIVKDRFPAKSQTAAVPEVTAVAEVAPTLQVDVVEQLHRLASLRDAGILTEDEFATKKAELLARL